MEKKTEEIIENNVVEFSIILSLIEQLNDNHEVVVRLAQKAEKKEISDYIVAYETLRLSNRTTDLLNLIHRLVSAMNDANEELLTL